MKTHLTLCSLFAALLGAAPAMAATTQVRGTLQFEDTDADRTMTPVARPIRAVKVTVVNQAGVEINSAPTADNGQYIINVDRSFLHVGDTLSIVFQSSSEAANVKLDTDWFDDSLSWTRSTIITDVTKPIVIDDLVTVADMSVHFSILDAIQRGREFANGHRDDTDDISTIDVQYPDKDWTQYSEGVWSTITVQGLASHGYGHESPCALPDCQDDGFDDEAVLHEYGHSLEHDISDVDGPNDARSHDACSDFGYEFAWDEGWATFFAFAVRASNGNASSLLGRLFGGVGSVEKVSTCSASGPEGVTYPPSVEERTTNTLWDLFDGATVPAEPFDRVQGDVMVPAPVGKTIDDLMFAVFDHELDDAIPYSSDPPTNILSFHDALMGRLALAPPGTHAAIDLVYFANGIEPHALPSYGVSGLSFSPSTVAPGQPTTASFTATNEGVKVYAGMSVHLRITAVPYPYHTTFTLSDFDIPVFDGTQVVTRSIVLPGSFPDDRTAIAVQIDPLGVFADLDVADNTAANDLKLGSCGNHRCGLDESPATCPGDCQSHCGIGGCEAYFPYSETAQNCPSDCLQ